MTSTSTLPRRNRFRLRAAGIVAALGLMVGLGAAQSANAWVYLGGVPVQINRYGTDITDNYVTCNSPKVWTVAEEYKTAFVSGPHGGVYVQFWFHVRDTKGYWHWLTAPGAVGENRWVSLGDYGGVENAWASAPAYESNEVQVYFKRWNSTQGKWEYQKESARPYITQDAWGCWAEHQGLR